MSTRDGDRHRLSIAIPGHDRTDGIVLRFSFSQSCGNLEGGMTTNFGNVSQVLRFKRQYSQINCFESKIGCF